MDLKELFLKMDLTLDDSQVEKYNKYTSLMVDYNEKVNLTSILDPDEQDDKEYVSIAVNQNGLALEHASERLKDDIDIIYAAVRNSGWAYHHVSPRRQENPDIIALALRTSPELSGYGVGRKNNNKRN